MALSCLESRMAFGVALPAATRRGYWWRLVDLTARLGTFANPDAPAMATAAGRERQEREVESALLAFDSYRQTHIVPRLGRWPASTPKDETPSPEIGGGQVLPFMPPANRVARPTVKVVAAHPRGRREPSADPCRRPVRHAGGKRGRAGRASAAGWQPC
jgi:hypothetical protein